jgi:acyl-CoA thioesterase
MEAETARDAVWTTVQFVGSADVGERVECHVEVLASGRRTSQLRLTATVGDRTVLAAMGSTGVHRQGPIEAQIGTMPDVPSPEDADEWGHRWNEAAVADVGWHLLTEMRQVELDDKRFAIWSRMRDQIQSLATIVFLAYMVPSSVARAAGYMGGGTSLDNAMRFGRFTETDWVLLDFDPWLAAGGYLHGGARVWGEDGTLLGYANQTASARVWRGESPPWLEKD